MSGPGNSAATGHTGGMLRAANWVVRVTAIIVVGVATFAGSDASSRAITAQVVAFAVGCALVAVWALMARWQEAHPAPAWLLPAILLAMVTCASVCTTTDGAAMIAFGIMATLAAGGDTGVITSWAITVLGVLTIEVGGLITGASTSAMLGYPLVLVVAVLSGHNRRSFRVQAEQSAVMLEQIELLRTEQRQVAVLDERNRIAREIHDVLAHSLGALSIQIQASRALLSDQRDVEGSLRALDKAQRMASDGLTETRRAVLALRTDARPLTDELELLVDAHRGRHHVDVTVEIEGEARALSAEADLALLRTAQESLVNAAKHAGGEPIAIRLGYGDGVTSLTITNAVGAKTSTGNGFGTIDGGYGLLGMRERLMLLSGTLSAGLQGDHWVVNAQVPQ